MSTQYKVPCIKCGYMFETTLLIVALTCPVCEEVTLVGKDRAVATKEQAPPRRGQVLFEAHKIINGERQDTYGSPEDSFELIASYWNVYMRSVCAEDHNLDLTGTDVAMMMTLFKIAREANQHKADNIVDACGYLGIYGSMQGS